MARKRDFWGKKYNIVYNAYYYLTYIMPHREGERVAKDKVRACKRL